VKRAAWLAIGRELLRLGLIAAAPGKFATLQLTEAGRAALRERKPITLTKPFDVETTKRSKKHRAGDLECDETLFAQLRVLRRQIADERDVPAYVIFSDVSLREMSRVYPTTSAEFGRIPGVGQQKLRDFAEPFTSAIRGYLTSNPYQPRVSNQRG
jgi:ATP-dependent DNA helicase RecQ